MSVIDHSYIFFKILKLCYLKTLSMVISYVHDESIYFYNNNNVNEFISNTCKNEAARACE